jgi:aspartate/glutamate racemase
MSDLIRVGILGGFGPLPTARLYARLSCGETQRPEVIVHSPAISQEHEKMLLAHDAEGAGLRDSMRALAGYFPDMAAVPSVTVASLLRESGMPATPGSDWFESIANAVSAVSPRRLGVIATSAVIEHSELVRALRAEGVRIVSASRIQGAFHEWVLSCGTCSAMIPPHEHLVVRYREFFREEGVDACLLACTEACLPETAFGTVHSTVISALSILEDMCASWIRDTAHPPLHVTPGSRTDSTVCIW